MFFQVRIRPEERDAHKFHWLKNIPTKEVETLRFTGAGVIEQHLDTWNPKQPEIVLDIKNMYVDDLTSGGTTVPKAREMKDAGTEIFADAGLELHKWHSNNPELKSAENRSDCRPDVCRTAAGNPIKGRKLTP